MPPPRKTPSDHEAQEVRCVNCRRQNRSEKALRAALERARAKLAERPADARATLAAAEAILPLR
jgi:hypothetical protein